MAIFDLFKHKFISIKEDEQRYPDFKFIVKNEVDYVGHGEIACDTGYKAKTGKYLYAYLESDPKIKLFIKKRSFKPGTAVETNEQLLDSIGHYLEPEQMHRVIDNIDKFVESVMVSFLRYQVDQENKKVYHIHLDHLQDRYLRFIEAYLVLDGTPNARRVLKYLNLDSDIL